MMPIPAYIRARMEALSEVAKETQKVLPDVLVQLPLLQAEDSQVYNLARLPQLDASAPPRFELASSSTTPSGPTKTYGTLVKVLNEDTFDAAIMMADSLTQHQQPSTVTTTATATGAAATAQGPSTMQRNQRIAVMNLASEKKPGGGWLTGALAQEEALCYRSSLSLSLHKTYYPLEKLDAVYTRDVVVVRSSMDAGHQLLHTDVSPVRKTPYSFFFPFWISCLSQLITACFVLLGNSWLFRLGPLFPCSLPFSEWP